MLSMHLSQVWEAFRDMSGRVGVPHLVSQGVYVKCLSRVCSLEGLPELRRLCLPSHCLYVLMSWETMNLIDEVYLSE
jgi:hypothetical protein